MGVAVFKESYYCENCNESLWRLPDYGNGSPTERLAQYEEAEEQGLLLRLPCAVGSEVYIINSKRTKCTENDQEFDEYWCQGCECDRCDSHREYYIHKNTQVSLEWIVRYFSDFGKTVFFTQEDAEQALKQMRE